MTEQMQKIRDEMAAKLYRGAYAFNGSIEQSLVRAYTRGFDAAVKLMEVKVLEAVAIECEKIGMLHDAENYRAEADRLRGGK